VAITEKSFTGNQDYAEMWENKLKWKTVDDSVVGNFLLTEEGFDSLVLEKQRIRVFEIEYVI